MKKILTFLFCLGLVYANAQVYTKPNNSFGTIFNRGANDSTLHFPTGCGAPTDSTYLREHGIKQRINTAAIYYDSCGHVGYIWDPAVRGWLLIGGGSGSGGVDSVYARGDSVFYRKAGNEYFSFVLPATGSDTALAHRVDTLTHTVDTLSDDLDSTKINLRAVDANLAALIAQKVTNYAGVSIWGYGTWAGRPMSSTGLYYSNGPDSIGIFYANAGVFTRLTNDPGKVYPVYLAKEGGRGKMLLRVKDSVTIGVKGLIDSGRLHWAFAVATPGDTAMALVLDTTGLGGGGTDSTILPGYAIKQTYGTGPTAKTKIFNSDTASPTQPGVTQIGDYIKQHTKIYPINDSAGPGVDSITYYDSSTHRWHFKGFVFGSGFLTHSTQGVNYVDLPSISGKYYYDIVADGGADPSGVADATAIINTALSIPNRYVIFPPGTYKTLGQINITASNIYLKGGGRGSTHIVSGSSVTCTIFHGYNCSNINIDGIDFQNTYTGATHSNVYKLQMDTIFDGVHHATLDSNIEISNCRFTGPKCDGALFISHRNGFGGNVRHVNVHDNIFEYLGYAGGGMLGEYATETIYDFHFDDNRIRHTGLADTTLGFAFSGSALSHGNTINGNYATDYKMIGFEMTMFGYSRMIGNQGDSAYTGITCLLSVNSTGAKAQFGNVVENNITLDSTPNLPYIMSQKRLRMSNNVFKAYAINTSVLIDSVFESSFVGETYIKTASSGQARTLYIRRGSRQLTFNACNIIGYPVQFSLILAQDSSTHIKFNDCYTTGYTSNATLINSDSTNIDLSGTFYNPVSNTVNYAVLPIATSPAFNIVADANGRISKSTFSSGGFSPSAYSLHGKLGGTDTSIRYSVFNVLDFGAVADSNITDNTAAFQKTIDLASGTVGGRVYIPAGRYKISGTLRTYARRPIFMYGDGGPAITYLNNFVVINNYGASILYFTSTSDTCIRNFANGSTFQSFGIVCNQGTGASTNLGIYSDSASHCLYDNLFLQNFSDNFYIRAGVQYTMNNMTSVDAHKYYYHVQGYDGLDAGDGRAEDVKCYSTNATYLSIAIGFQYENGGGLQVLHCKLGGGIIGFNSPFQGYTDLVIDNSSFEAISGTPIVIAVAASKSLTNFHITNNQMIGSGTRGIDLDASASGSSIANGIVADNIVTGPLITTDTGLYMHGPVTDVRVHGNKFVNFTSHVVTNIGGSTPRPMDVTPPLVQTVIESGNKLVADLHFGNVIQASVSTTDTLDIINSGWGNDFTIQIGTAVAGVNLIIRSGLSTSYTQTASNTIFLNPVVGQATMIKGYTIGSAYIISSVQTSGWTNQSVPFWNGLLTQDNANFFYNPTAHQLFLTKGLGINTTSAGMAALLEEYQGATGYGFNVRSDVSHFVDFGVRSTTQGFIGYNAALSGTGILWNAAGDVVLNGTGGTIINAGTTAQRPTGLNGMVRYNTDSSYYEYWSTLAGAWKPIAGAATPGGANFQFQYYNSGSFSGATNLVYDPTQNGILLTSPSLGVTQNNAAGIWIKNPTASTTGQAQWSPSLTFEGNAWNSTAGASQLLRYTQFMSAVSSTTLIPIWNLAYQNNNSTNVQALSFTPGVGLGVNTNSAGTSGIVDGYQTGTNYGFVSRIAGGAHYADFGTRSTTLGFMGFDAQLSGTGVTFDAAGSFTFNGTGASIMNKGTTAQRPGSPVAGMHRVNTDSANNYEYYDGSAWHTWANNGSGGVGNTPTLQQVFNVGGGGKAFLSKSDTISGGTANNFIIDSALSIILKGQTASLSSQNGAAIVGVSNTGIASIGGATVGLTGNLNVGDNTVTTSFTLTNSSTPYYYITLNTPSSNQTITIPSQTFSGVTTYRILNRSQSTSFNWSFTGGTLQDAFGNSVTAIPNGYAYEIAQQSAAIWVIKNISYVGFGRTGIPIAGSYSSVGTATTTFTVTIGVTEPITTYKINVTPTDALAAALYYVTNKTATTFDVVYISGLTGTVSFDWNLTP